MTLQKMNWRLKFDDIALKQLEELCINERAAYVKCFKIVTQLSREPHDGIGHPERLKHKKSQLPVNTAMWSRRVTKEHRLVYLIDYENGEISILTCKKHYEGI